MRVSLHGKLLRLNKCCACENNLVFQSVGDIFGVRDEPGPGTELTLIIIGGPHCQGMQ